MFSTESILTLSFDFPSLFTIMLLQTTTEDLEKALFIIMVFYTLLLSKELISPQESCSSKFFIPMVECLL